MRWIIAACAALVTTLAWAAGVQQPLLGASSANGAPRTIVITVGTGVEAGCSVGATPTGFNGAFGSATGTSLGGGVTLTALVFCTDTTGGVKSVVRATGFGADPGANWFYGGPCFQTSNGASLGSFLYPPYTAVTYTYLAGTATWQYLTLPGGALTVNATCNLGFAQ